MSDCMFKVIQKMMQVWSWICFGSVFRKQLFLMRQILENLLMICCPNCSQGCCIALYFQQEEGPRFLSTRRLFFVCSHIHSLCNNVLVLCNTCPDHKGLKLEWEPDRKDSWSPSAEISKLETGQRNALCLCHLSEPAQCVTVRIWPFFTTENLASWKDLL